MVRHGVVQEGEVFIHDVCRLFVVFKMEGLFQVEGWTGTERVKVPSPSVTKLNLVKIRLLVYLLD